MFYSVQPGPSRVAPPTPTNEETTPLIPTDHSRNVQTTSQPRPQVAPVIKMFNPWRDWFLKLKYYLVLNICCNCGWHNAFRLRHCQYQIQVPRFLLAAQLLRHQILQIAQVHRVVLALHLVVQVVRRYRLQLLAVDKMLNGTALPQWIQDIIPILTIDTVQRFLVHQLIQLPVAVMGQLAILHFLLLK